MAAIDIANSKLIKCRIKTVYDELVNKRREQMPLASGKPRLHAGLSFVSVQYLRGIAAVAVVYFHTKVYMPNFFWPVDRSFGYAGVDIFFAISGFIMMVTTSVARQSPIEFLTKRALRIYPIYWIATFTALAIFVIYPSAFAKGEGMDATFIISSLLLLPIHSEAAASEGAPFLKIAWTLVFEVFFYSVFASCICITNNTKRLVTIVIVMLIFVTYGLVAAPQSAMLRFYTNPLILEFLFGCIVGHLVLSDHIRIGRGALACVLIVSLILIGFGSGHGDRFARLVWFGAPAAIVVFCCAYFERRYGSVPSIPVLRLLGDASYSIYLFQSFMLISVRLVAEQFHLFISEPIAGTIGVLLAITFAVVGGVIIHALIERPCLLFARRLMRFLSHRFDGLRVGQAH